MYIMLPNREELSELYPRPKTYQELRERQKRYEIESRPKRTSVKVGTCVTLGVLGVFATYYLINYLFQEGLSSQAGVIFSVFFAMFVLMVSFVVLGYLYSIVSNIMHRMLVSDILIRFCLTLIIVGSLVSLFTAAENGFGLPAFILISILCFFFSSLAMRLVTNSQLKED